MRQELESSFATVFRQTMMARYESDAYAARGENRTLTPDRLSEMWLDRNRDQYGDAVELPDGYRLGWSYIPHFINTRFYTYAYAFAHLASLVLYAHLARAGRELRAAVPRVPGAGRRGLRRPTSWARSAST